MGTFTGRQAIVTGAGSGIGAALCRALAGAGAEVVCTDVDGDRGAGHRRTARRPVAPARRHRRGRRADCVDRGGRPGRAARPDVQQRRYHLGRGHRTADPGPVERDHRRQHPRRGARGRRRLPGDGAPGSRAHREHRLDGRAGRRRPDHQLRDDQARRRRAVAGAALARPPAAGSGCWRSARPRSRRPSWTRVRSAGSSAAISTGWASAARRSPPPTTWPRDTLRAIERNKALLVWPRQARMAWRFARYAPGLLQRMSIRFVAQQRAAQGPALTSAGQHRQRTGDHQRPHLRPAEVVVGGRPGQLQHAALIGDVHRRRVRRDRRSPGLAGCRLGPSEFTPSRLT